MSNIYSHKLYDGPVSKVPNINTIRATVQYRKNKPLQIMLIKDTLEQIKKLGLDLDFYEAGGKLKSASEISKMLVDVVNPEIEKCFIGFNDGTKEEQIKAIAPYIKIIEDTWHIPIPILKNPNRPELGLRNPGDVCKNITQFYENLGISLMSDETFKKDIIDKTKKKIISIKEELKGKFVGVNKERKINDEFYKFDVKGDKENRRNSIENNYVENIVKNLDVLGKNIEREMNGEPSSTIFNNFISESINGGSIEECVEHEYHFAKGNSIKDSDIYLSNDTLIFLKDGKIITGFKNENGKNKIFFESLVGRKFNDVLKRIIDSFGNKSDLKYHSNEDKGEIHMNIYCDNTKTNNTIKVGNFDLNMSNMGMTRIEKSNRKNYSVLPEQKNIDKALASIEIVYNIQNLNAKFDKLKESFKSTINDSVLSDDQYYEMFNYFF